MLAGLACQVAAGESDGLCFEKFCKWLFVLKFRFTPGFCSHTQEENRRNGRIVSHTDCSRKHLNAQHTLQRAAFLNLSPTADSFIVTFTHTSSYVQLVATLCCSFTQGPHSANTTMTHCEQLQCEETFLLLFLSTGDESETRLFLIVRKTGIPYFIVRTQELYDIHTCRCVRDYTTEPVRITTEANGPPETSPALLKAAETSDRNIQQ